MRLRDGVYGRPLEPDLPMRTALLFLLMSLPLLEIGLLIKVGGMIGFWPTLGIIVLTAMLGGAIIVQNGFSSALRIQEAMLRGEAPLGPILESAMVVAAGVLLITPGLIADSVGLLLLVPPLRRLAARSFARAMFGLEQPQRPSGTRPERPEADATRQPRGTSGDGPVIEGEFERLDERPVDPAAPPRRPRQPFDP